MADWNESFYALLGKGIQNIEVQSDDKGFLGSTENFIKAEKLVPRIGNLKSSCGLGNFSYPTRPHTHTSVLKKSESEPVKEVLLSRKRLVRVGKEVNPSKLEDVRRLWFFFKWRIFDDDIVMDIDV